MRFAPRRAGSVAFFAITVAAAFLIVHTGPLAQDLCVTDPDPTLALWPPGTRCAGRIETAGHVTFGLMPFLSIVFAVLLLAAGFTAVRPGGRTDG
jgi:hypothetical protein